MTTSILWHDLYAAALLELDRANLRGRIDLEARQWVEGRPTATCSPGLCLSEGEIR